MEEFILVISRLGIGAVATFLAIVLWAKTRDSAWMFIIMGIIIKYGAIMYSTFKIYGIISSGLYTINGIPVVDLVLENLPTLFFIIGLLIMILRSRGR